MANAPTMIAGHPSAPRTTSNGHANSEAEPKVGLASPPAADIATGAAPASAPTPVPMTGSILPGLERQIEPEFAAAIKDMETALKMPLWLFIQGRERGSNQIDDNVRDCFQMFKASLPKGHRVALLIDSPGGSAKCAYQIATLLRRQCGGFVAVVPRYAKSAGTLLALGGSEIRMGEQAELGPLDAQLFDGESEEWRSALDEFQALERLNAFALEVADRSMFQLLRRTGKKVDTLLPKVLHFAADLTKPLLDKTDPVRYTTASRALKIAEEYATRLLQPKYPARKAQEIARHLVERYPDHGFVIDRQEAESFGLKTEAFSPEQDAIADRLFPFLGEATVMGQLIEAKTA
ncbi:MAG: hypothetical protein KF869_00615 [Phycisphaeraceae bacterium]|nr:hypothetical protein [Phycisphaeraceae bacterium]